jgi:hypothetical protein
MIYILKKVFVNSAEMIDAQATDGERFRGPLACDFLLKSF